MSHFDAYGRNAKKQIDPIFQNGRYPAQRDAEKLIPADIIKKLQISQEDNVLDVGCGLGLNLLAVAPFAAQITGCDHPDVIARLKKEQPLLKAELLGGDFLALDLQAYAYNKILIYSVLPALPSKVVLLAFVDKALTLLREDGILLLGDMANIDKKRRFLQSKRGQAFQKEWLKRAPEDQLQGFAEFETETECVTINDALIAELLLHIRTKGFDAYTCDQPLDLPFGNTREDIIVYGPENKRA